MEENYLVILGSHVDSEKKRDVVIETLKHFKEENIDVWKREIFILICK